MIIRTYVTMKKAFLSIVSVAALSALMLCSCQKDSETVNFNATITTYGQTGKASKTYIDDNRYCNWINQDKVLVNGTVYTVGVTGTGDDRIATIANVAKSESGYYAYYPADGATIGTGWPAKVLLPQVQNYRTDGQGNQIVDAPMAAYCLPEENQTASLNFTNLCALLKIELPSDFDITTNEVAYIVVSSSNKPLWGEATISGTTQPTLSEPSLANLYSSDYSVTLDFTNNGVFGSDGSSSTSTGGTNSAAATGVRSRGPFYVVLPPATNVSGLTVDIYVFNSSSSNNRRTVHLYHKTGTSSVNIVSNKMYGIGEVDIDSYTQVPDVPYPNLGSGEFSVGPNKKVRFALGNLQYQASTNTFRFAENQQDRLRNSASGGNTVSASSRSTSDKWIDLFGYGTSGVTYNSHTYYPWNSSITVSDYAIGNIYNTGYDWGVNKIANGGNQPNKWRTLTRAEWVYLTDYRCGVSGSGPWANRLQRNNVTVGGINGTIFLPDVFATDNSLSSYVRNGYWDDFDAEKWADVSSKGAIFIPSGTGYRRGEYVNTSKSYGYYWTSSVSDASYDPNPPTIIYFQSSGEAYLDNRSNTSWPGNRATGCAVRLVRDVN